MFRLGLRSSGEGEEERAGPRKGRWARPISVKSRSPVARAFALRRPQVFQALYKRLYTGTRMVRCTAFCLIVLLYILVP